MTISTELGRRIERLLYFGAVLVLLCVALFYFATTAVYMNEKNPSGLAALANNLKNDLPKLQELYDKPINAKQDATDNRMRLIQATRARLNMRPEILPKVTDNTETYAVELTGIINRSSTETGMDASVLSKGINSTTPPLQAIAIVKDHLRLLSGKPLQIWGIETPTIVPFQYGKALYEIPASVIAISLLFFLAPLLIWWMGSFLLTRQRELLVLRNSDDYTIAFPHVLNILPVMYKDLPWLSEKEKYKRRNFHRNRLFGHIFYASLRSIVLILISTPMVVLYIYSEFQVINIQLDTSIFAIVCGIFFGLWLALQNIFIVAQEWLILWGKVYWGSWD